MSDPKRSETALPEDEPLLDAEELLDEEPEAYIPPPPTMRPWAQNLLALVLGTVVGMIPGVIALAVLGRDFYTVDAMYLALPLAMYLFLHLFRAKTNKLVVIPMALCSYAGMFGEVWLLNKFHNIFETVWSGVRKESVYAHLFILLGLVICFELLPKPEKRTAPAYDEEDEEEEEEEDEDADDDEYEYYYDDEEDEESKN